MGVLVGTSLIVIIPEGIEALYSASGNSHLQKRRDWYSSVGNVRWVQNHARSEAAVVGFAEMIEKRDKLEDVDSHYALPGPVVRSISTSTPRNSHSSTSTSTISQPSQQGSGSDKSDGKSDDRKTEHHDNEHAHGQERSPHAYVGLSLILGFILMYLIDKLPRHASATMRPPSASCWGSRTGSSRWLACALGIRRPRGRLARACPSM